MSPPSVDFQSAEPSPPLSKKYGVAPEAPGRGVEDARIRRVHRQVDRAGVAIDEEDALPVLAAVARAIDAAHVVRAEGVAQRGDVDEVGIRSDGRGCARCAASRRGRCASSVLPASVDFHIPSPCETLPRTVSSPLADVDDVRIGLGATATAPIEPPKKPSETFFHVWPPSVVFQTPPPVEPK